MDRRFVLFAAVALLYLVVYAYVTRFLHPQPPNPIAQQNAPVAGKGPEAKPAAQLNGPAEKPPPAKEMPAKPAAPGAKPKPVVPAENALPERWVTLGSADPASPYRMLVTLSNRGAAVTWIELSNPRFRDLDDRGGYLGHVTTKPGKPGAGCPVDVVGPGTPGWADGKGLQVGDLIRQIDEQPIGSQIELEAYLDRKRPGQAVTLTVLRQGKEVELPPLALGRQPLEVVKPEARDPLSFLMTLRSVDDDKLEPQAPDKLTPDERLAENDNELPGVTLRSGTWTVVESDQDHVLFRRVVQPWGLEVTKSYRLEKVPDEDHADDNFKAYHLVFDVSLKNVGDAAHKVAYQLDGPTGLPTEGYWYAYKSWTSWGAVGLRDMVISYKERFPELITCPQIADDKIPAPWNTPEPLTFIGVDAQYFSAVMLPQPKSEQEVWFAQSQALRVGRVDPDWKTKTNTSCRLVSVDYDLKPGQQVSHQYLLFAGPKRPDLLTQYGLENLVYYGWFSWIARPMSRTLHFFYAIVRNYGIAIILLTALVRLCMFPMSRKQTFSTIKMQELQPQIKKLREKHKDDARALMKAQQELFRKNHVNQYTGCLTVFIQLPIFVALYRSLAVDVELRQAPLISGAVRWCSNLAGPDMLFNWSGFMPEFITNRPGILGLGPYFNILPIVTILLFLWQQKKMMPPPADEQAAMQQKVMQWMMVFMGLMFFKVASGLCLYFVASSLWGMGERKFLPKLSHADGGGGTPAPRPLPAPRPNDRDGAAARNRKRSRK